MGHCVDKVIIKNVVVRWLTVVSLNLLALPTTM